MRICILAGGPTESLPDLSTYNDNDIESLWVGVDRGVHTLLENGITPHAAFGDFDSVSEVELQTIREAMEEVHLYPSEKDETDLEIAFDWAARQAADELYIFGATGGRLDHLLGNIQLLLREEIVKKHARTEICIVDKTNILTAKLPGVYKLEVIPDKKYVSFVPVTGEVKGITLHGFKYPLENCQIKIGSTLCISNELISESGTFSFTDGILLVIRSSD
ncbi:thiamine diphosphokinase [Peribacillus cavernae]|uniref:Thiamine diphosphokinase n=1 Tax=Peribacillus cavernae TaxID=1674310 RepID=A0A3S1B8B0_9BACI|nr:thiamine diphosphokinase [Peribacillus cavernae]MDQ0217122.1 thiamine pyrophosphokinase [Peribacillus cavernae]RUQ30401.1 thiamine diphosphokinase [Peribacillus cavernae]